MVDGPQQFLALQSDTVGRWGGIRFPLQSKTDAGS